MSSKYVPIPCLAALLVLAASPLLAQSGFIEGSVHSEGGSPLAGMVVAAYNTAGELAVTNVTTSNGSYLLSLPAATYRVLAYDTQGTWATSFYNDAGSFETSAEISVLPGITRPGVNFRLRRAHRIEGIVRSVANAPLTEMTVSAYNLDGTRRGFQKSGSDGKYSLSLPAGQYKLAAWDDALAYAPEFYANARSFASASTISVGSSVFGIDFSLEPAARVTGRVTAQSTGQPLRSIDVSAYDVASGERIAFVSTNATGDFQFALMAGRYKFSASDPAKKYATLFFAKSASFEAAASFDLAPGELRPGLDFALIEATEPPQPTTLFVPAVINAPGGAGSYWRTDLWIYNPGQGTLTVAATYVAATGRVERTITVPPRGQAGIENIVESLFGTSGTGSLRLRAEHPFAAVSRTFNTPQSGGDAGTYGFSIAAMDAGATLALAVLPSVAQNTAYRTNIGLMNPHEHAVAIEARLYSAAGVLLGTTSRSLDALAVDQPALTSLFGEIQVTGGYVVLSSTDGSFFSYASVVDNRSNDPTLVLPSADTP
ncbi:MAG TPA: carboxypeptidase-like regulatory domain-containing protein [Thermoanaerobaculia bacterium]